MIKNKPTNYRGWRNLNQSRVSAGIKTWPLFKLFFNPRERRVLLKDYQPKTFVNPFFRQLNQYRRTPATKIKLILVSLLLITGLGLLLKHPYFNISQINLSGAKAISSESLLNIINSRLDKKKLLLFSRRNYWLANTVEISQALSQQYSLASLKITKSFPQVLNVELTEKEAAVIYQVANQKWLVDNQGKIIQEVLAGEIVNALPIVYSDSASSSPAIDSLVILPATVKFLTYLQTKIPEIAKIDIAFAKIKDAEGRVVHLTTTEKWQIYLDRQNDWEKQINVLTAILNTKLKNSRAKLRYIDVRYENRAYFQ